jgi:stage V sporulation protein B
VKGAAISTVVAYFIAGMLDLSAVKRYSKVKFNMKEVFIKPFLSSLGMAVAAFLGYRLFEGILGGKISTLIGIFIGVIVYFILLIITGAITNEDFKILPKGDKIAGILYKLKLLK